jgi:hypothetical protein
MPSRAGSVTSSLVTNDDERRPEMARATTKSTTKTTIPETVDLHKALLEALAAEGVKPKVKWAPSKSCCSLYAKEQNIGYVFKATRNGIRIEPAAGLGDMPAEAKRIFKKGTRSERFASVGVVADEKGVKAAVLALVAAAKKQAAAKS